MTRGQAMMGETAQVFASRIVCYVCTLLIAGDGWLLGQLWARGDALFGRDSITGHDLAVFWAAGRLAWLGQAAAAYDWTAIHDLLHASLGTTSVQYVTIFGYPPWFLLALAPLGALQYPVAAAIWLVAPLALYLATLRKLLPGGTALIAALAAPAVFSNIVLGQDGLLTAGLFAGACLLLDAAPVGSGIMIGLLAYKPQFGVLLPLFLMATGRWRVFASAAATVGGLAAVAGMVFGLGVFAAFAGALPTAGSAYLEHSALFVGEWGQLANVYGLLRALGLDAATAWSGHIAVAAAAAGGLLWVVKRNPRAELQAASLATAAVIVSPYSHLYDLAILAVPLAFLARYGLTQRFAAAEWAALAAAFLLPLALPLALRTGPDRLACVMGPLVCVILALLIGRRILADAARRPVGHSQAPQRIPRNFAETVPLGDD